MDKILTDTREEFLRKNAQFFESGLLQELYHNDYASVLNVADSGYVATDYSMDNNGNTVVVMVDKGNVRYIAYDNKGYYDILRQFFKSGIAKRKIFVLDEKAFSLFSEIQKKTSKDGPTEFIDKEMDAELLERKEKEYGGRSR